MEDLFFDSVQSSVIVNAFMNEHTGFKVLEEIKALQESIFLLFESNVAGESCPPEIIRMAQQQKRLMAIYLQALEKSCGSETTQSIS